MTPEAYDGWYDTPRGRWIGETEYRLVRRLLAPRPGETLLDVGCGTGWFSRRLAARDALNVTGLDIEPSWLAYARTRDPRTSYLQGDARTLPFADGSFDQVLSITALGFIDDWPRALAEILRVGRRRFVVGVLNRHSLLWRDKGRGGGTGAHRSAHWHTAGELRRALAPLPAR